jgi:hypothetical protein
MINSCFGDEPHIIQINTADDQQDTPKVPDLITEKIVHAMPTVV